MSEALSKNSKVPRRNLHRVFAAMVIIGGGAVAMIAVGTGDWVEALWGGVLTAYGILAWRQGQKPSTRIGWGMPALVILFVVLTFVMLAGQQ